MQTKYMRDNLNDDFGFLQLQDKILEIAKYIDAFCEEHHIEYCLMGGSALGAKRHGGFIPWDDDLDIFMTPDNYERFRSCFKESGDHNRFYLQEYGLQKNGMVTIPKLRLNNSTYIEEVTKDLKIHQGIFVDIFILHNCPNSTLKRKWQYFWARCAALKGLSMREYHRQKGIKQFAVTIAKILPKCLMLKFALKQVYKYRKKDCECFCNFLGKANFAKGIYKKEMMMPSKKVPFEKIELYAPNQLHEFLTSRFGDYMVIPSQNRIKWEQHASKWDCDVDFSNYVNKDRDFSDEKKLA